MRITDCETEAEYADHFENPEFGLPAAVSILERLGVTGTRVSRKVEGSSLLFRAGGSWLKLTPPFWADEIETEKKLLRHFGGKISWPIPRILHEGDFAGWKFVVVSHVAGAAFLEIQRDFGDRDRDALVEDLSRLMLEIFGAAPIPLERGFPAWDVFAGNRIHDVGFHRRKGVSEFWIGQIRDLLREVGSPVSSLGSLRIIHADLNHEHVRFRKSDGWRMGGLIDFGDGMLAPREVELILPSLVFFRGDKPRQRLLLERIGIDPLSYGVPFSRLMMGLTLCNRFVHFERWFAQEIQGEGLKDIREIADRVFL